MMLWMTHNKINGVATNDFAEWKTTDATFIGEVNNGFKSSVTMRNYANELRGHKAIP